MAKKKRVSIAATFGEVVSDVANAMSVAVTGSEIGVLELAAEDELKPTRAKRVRKAKPIRKKRAAIKKATRLMKNKRAKKRL